MMIVCVVGSRESVIEISLYATSVAGERGAERATLPAVTPNHYFVFALSQEVRA